MRRIADVLQARGELNQALRIRREEELPVYERLGDVRSRAVTLYKIATALLASGGLKQGRIQEICEALVEAFAIARQLGLPDGIGHFGLQLAHLMVMSGLRAEALAVLDEVDAAFACLGDANGRQAAAELRDAIGGERRT